MATINYALSPTVNLKDDGTIGTARSYHTDLRCGRLGKKTKAVSEDVIGLLGLTECRTCIAARNPLDPAKAVRVLKRAAEEALTAIRQGNHGKAEGFLVDALSAVENRSYEEPEVVGADEED